MIDDNKGFPMDIIDEMILEGSVQVFGMSDAGEPLYQFTEKVKDLRPEIYDSMMDENLSEIMKLWELGFLSMDITDSNPSVRITEKALDNSEVNKLPVHLQFYINQIIEAMRI